MDWSAGQLPLYQVFFKAKGMMQRHDYTTITSYDRNRSPVINTAI